MRKVVARLLVGAAGARRCGVLVGRRRRGRGRRLWRPPPRKRRPPMLEKPSPAVARTRSPWLRGAPFPRSGRASSRRPRWCSRFPRNEFEKVVDRARVLATARAAASSSSRAPRRAAGTAGSSAGPSSCASRSGRYARVMEQLSGLGRVEGREEAGQDVSQEFVDLEARDRHLEAVEAPAAGPARRDEHGRRGADGAIAAEPGAARPGAGARPPPVPRRPGRLRHDLARRS